MRSLLIATLAACSGSSTAPDASDNCANDPRAETFTVGLEHMGDAGALDFKLMSVDPAPPARTTATMYNTWIVQINAMSNGVVGAPMTNEQMSVTPFMPDHGHGTAIIPVVTAQPTAGQYQIAKIDTWMPGLWEITIAATTAPADQTVYRFCIAN